MIRLTADEEAELAAALSKYQCPLERDHDIRNEEDCWSCSAILILVMLVIQDDRGNDLTGEAIDLLPAFERYVP